MEVLNFLIISSKLGYVDQKRLSELGIASNICDLFPDKDNGFDLADYLAENLKEETVLDKMVSKNPTVKTLIERFEFEEC